MADEPLELEDWWVRGWLLGKYGQRESLPRTEDEAAEWLAGYQVGRAEIGQYETWQDDLKRDCPQVAEVLGL